MNITAPVEPRLAPASTTQVALGTFAALPRSIKLVAGGVLVVAVLLAVGVPLSALVPFAGLAACLGMHLLMGHGGRAHPGPE